MDRLTLDHLTRFVSPLYQDLDGANRLVDVERVSRIARALHTPETPDALRHFELLLLFQGLGGWLGRMGNATRILLSSAGAIDEASLFAVQKSLSRLGDPQSEAEKALAAAIRIDEAGLRGLAVRLAGARREGLTALEIAKEVLTQAPAGEGWLPEKARVWFETRRSRQREFSQAMLDETELVDLEIRD